MLHLYDQNSNFEEELDCKFKKLTFLNFCDPVLFTFFMWLSYLKIECKKQRVLKCLKQGKIIRWNLHSSLPVWGIGRYCVKRDRLLFSGFGTKNVHAPESPATLTQKHSTLQNHPPTQYALMRAFVKLLLIAVLALILKRSRWPNQSSHGMGDLVMARSYYSLCFQIYMLLEDPNYVSFN